MNVDLDAIEARVAAATDGPWRQGDEPWDHLVYPVIGEDCGCGGGIGYVKDAEFIAHARTDIPALIAEVRRLRTLHFEARQARKETAEHLIDKSTWIGGGGAGAAGTRT